MKSRNRLAAQHEPPPTHKQLVSEEETDSDEESDEMDSESDAEPTLEDQMAEVPFEVLERLRSDGRGPVGEQARQAAREAKATKFKRENRHRPQELSSKRPVGRFREVVQLPSRQSRDPRFDDSSGQLDRERFRKQYSFLYSDHLPQERQQIKAALKRAKDEEERRRLKSQLDRVESFLQEGKQAEKRAQLVTQLKAKEKDAVKGGKQPYFLKRSDVRKAELVDKYRELKASGRLHKFMEKRRKRNAAKDHKLLPGARD